MKIQKKLSINWNNYNVVDSAQSLVKVVAKCLTARLFMVGVFCLLSTFQSKVVAASPARLGFIYESSKSDFSEKKNSWYQDLQKNCSQCQMVNLTPYKENGAFDLSRLSEVIQQAPSQVDFLYLAWNDIYNPNKKEHQQIVDALKEITTKSFIVIGHAGYARESQVTIRLNRSVLGQIPKVIMIGELTERERLVASSYFGPEMLTAVKAEPVIFAIRLAKAWNKRNPGEWLQYFTQIKRKSSRLWPDLNEFFY